MLVNAYAKSSKLSRLMLCCFVAFLAALIAWDNIVNPHIIQLNTAKAYAAHTESFCKKGRQLDAITKIKKLEAEKLNIDSSYLLKRLFNLESAQMFFTSIENLAHQNNINIPSLKLLAETPEEQEQSSKIGVSKHRAALNVVGKYTSVINFLTQLSQYEQKLDIASIAFSTKGERVDCSMIITIYVTEQGGKK